MFGRPIYKQDQKRHIKYTEKSELKTETNKS